MHWILTAVLALTTALAMADHGVPAPARTGLGWTSWLLVAGAVVAVSPGGVGVLRAGPSGGSPGAHASGRTGAGVPDSMIRPVGRARPGVALLVP